MPFDFIPTELEPWQQLLLDAAQRVRRGWCQNALNDDRGNVCLMGALLEVSSRPGVQADAETTAYWALFQHIVNRAQGVVDFNDTPGRTAEEVASAMEAAAMETAHV